MMVGTTQLAVSTDSTTLGPAPMLMLAVAE
jgi:hypothetical protein